MLGLHHHLALGREQRGRGVAALLDVGRVRRADEHRAHLLADRVQRPGQHLKLDRIHQELPSARRWMVPVLVDLARPAGRDQQRGLGQLDHRRPLDRGAGRRHAAAAPRARPRSPSSVAVRGGSRSPSSRRRRLAERDLGAGHRRRHPQGHQLELLVGVAVAVALLVRGLEGLAQFGGLGLERALDGELERLAAVAQLIDGAQFGVGLVQLLAGRVAELGDDLRHRLGGERVPAQEARCAGRPPARGETTSPSAASTPEARGQTISVMPSSAAMAAACSGPAPPKASSA